MKKNFEWIIPVDIKVSDLLYVLGLSAGFNARLMAPRPDWLLLDDEVLLTEMIECGRLLPWRNRSLEHTAIELRVRAEINKFEKYIICKLVMTLW